jgi:hypothetical protein
MENNQTEYVEVPIELNFDSSHVIGSVRIKKEYASKIPRFALSPEFTIESALPNNCYHKLLSFGFVDADSYIKAYRKYNNSL